MELREVVDRLLITELMHAYADRVDRGDVEGVLALFTDDTVLDMGGGTIATTLAEVAPVVRRLVARWTFTSHHCSTTSFTSYGRTTAATTTYVYVFHDRPADDLTMHLWGRYEDEWAQGDRGWLIRRRTFRVAGVRHTASEDLPGRFERFTRLPVDGQADGLPVA